MEYKIPRFLTVKLNLIWKATPSHDLLRKAICVLSIETVSENMLYFDNHVDEISWMSKQIPCMAISIPTHA
jgi:hypothetical protein